MSRSVPQYLLPTGYVLIALTSLFFWLQLYVWPSSHIFDDAGFFWVNYVVSVAYFIAFVVDQVRRNGWRSWLKLDERVYSIALVLFSISAHTLNFTDIRLFEPYVAWLIPYMLLIHVAILAFPYRPHLPEFLQYAVYIISGAGVVLSLYMSIFIGPLLAISFPAALFFGISLHSYVPLWFLVYFLFVGARKLGLPYSKMAYWSGIMAPVLVLVIFMARWQDVQHEIEASQAEYELKYQDEFPEWVLLSQRLPDDPLTEAVLLSKTRTQESFWRSNSFMPITSTRGFEVRHDPMAVVARLLYGSLEIDAETLIPLLNSQYDARHQTHRRLWSGDDLSTRQVQTHIKAFPDYRLAYVEKTLTIRHNDSNSRRWNNQQEAVYTFYLPDGSVATSLSLWIEGEEQPARLTTRAKADSAYEAIVGVERRDPALLHWQEGNRLTVTVFPCTPDEDRKFKIGITIPLTYENERLSLENVYFDGPFATNTRETTRLQFEGTAPATLSTPGNWRRIHEREYEFEGPYLPDWRLEWEAPALSNGIFTFAGQSYSVQALPGLNQAFEPRAIILDINASWNREEIMSVWEKVKTYPVYVFLPEPVQVNEHNQKDLFTQLRSRRFSVLPLHRIDDPAHSLVIAKNPYNTPLLSDLEEGAFAQNMRDFLLQSEAKIKWYNLGSEAAAYATSLRTFRALDYAEGNLEGLNRMLTEKQFPLIPEDANSVALLPANVSIHQAPSDATVSSNAPDHLKRLFAYNQLLHDIGRQYFDREALEETWIRKAEEAFVVSPVSSLVVLETQADYERMGIDENRDTLGNASMSNSGSVPEPHEWALIVLVALVILWQMKRRWV